MRLLYFKARYVEPILSGEKADTIRRSARGLTTGDAVRACVGPDRPFAVLRIESVESVSISDLPPLRHAEVAALYPSSANLVQIRFALLEQLPVAPRLARALERVRRTQTMP